MGQKNFIEIKVLEISSNPVSINNNWRQTIQYWKFSIKIDRLREFWRILLVLVDSYCTWFLTLQRFFILLDDIDFKKVF